MLQRLVKHLMVQKTVEPVFEPPTTCASKEVTGPRLLHFFLLARVKKERGLLTDAYF